MQNHRVPPPDKIPYLVKMMAFDVLQEAMTCIWKQLEVAHLSWPLKDVGSQCTAMYTFNMDFTEFINNITYTYVFVTLLYTLSYVKVKMKINSY